MTDQAARFSILLLLHGLLVQISFGAVLLAATLTGERCLAAEPTLEWTAAVGPVGDRLRHGDLRKPLPPRQSASETTETRDDDSREDWSLSEPQSVAERNTDPRGIGGPPTDRPDSADGSDWSLREPTSGGSPVTARPASPLRLTETPPANRPEQPASASKQTTRIGFTWIEGEGFFLRGERAMRTFAVNIPDPRLIERAVLSIGFRNAADVRPDASRLHLRINDRHLVSLRLASVSGNTRARIRLPAGVLRQGQNTIAFEVVQRHRTACTIEATYELWTRVESSLTALHLQFSSTGAEATRADYNDWLRLYMGGGLPFSILLAASGADSGALRWAGLVAQGIGLRLEQIPPRIRLIPSTDGAGEGETLYIDGLRELDGANLSNGPLMAMVGPRDALRRHLSDAVYQAIQGALWTLIPVTNDANTNPTAPLLLVTGRTRHETLAAARAFAAASARGLTSGQREPEDVSVYHFQELRIGPWANNALRGQLTYPIKLPPDAFTATDASILMDVEGRIAEDIGPKADLLVSVNGEVAGWLPFRNGPQGTLRGPPVTMPLRIFRPGFNEVQLTARLPLGDQEACPTPIDQRYPEPQSEAAKRARLYLTDESVLRWPAVTRLSALPSLSAMAAWAHPYSSNNEEASDIYVASSDVTTISSAMTVIARLSQAAKTPLTTLFTLDAPSLSDRNIIAIGAIGDFPADFLARGPISRDALQQRLVTAPFVPEEAQDEPPPVQPLLLEEIRKRMIAAGRGSVLIDNLTGPLGSPEETASVAADRTQIPEVQADTGGPLTQMRILLTQLLNHLVARLQGVGGLGSADAWLRDYRRPVTALVLQMRSPQAQGRTWTVFTAADRATLGENVDATITPRIWHKLDGAITVMDTAGEQVGTYQLREQYYPNLRLTDLSVLLLVSGTWLSRNTLFLLGAVGFLVFTLSILTQRLVLHDR